MQRGSVELARSVDREARVEQKAQGRVVPPGRALGEQLEVARPQRPHQARVLLDRRVHGAGVASPARGEELVDRPGGRLGAQARQQLGDVAASEPDGKRVGPDPLAVPQLDVGAALDEQLDEAHVATPQDRVVKRAVVRVGARVEQEP
jgi:hypothetical protein